MKALRTFMRAYIVVTGILFAGIIVAHVMRVAAEGTHLLTAPWFMLLTALAAGMCGWAVTIFRRLPA
jgi:hypothetical protein